MKKAKVILTSIAVFAVVGGALAFKAKGGSLWCTTQINQACSDRFELSNASDAVDGYCVNFATASSANDCIQVTTSQKVKVTQ